uniref:Uncharacterized protein n=1 Tax=Mycena chlorophos TaxID=658473 RepID=A0ABQ0L0U9_MYCCL|nr:predicted protein [Mycena chlorophos]
MAVPNVQTPTSQPHAANGAPNGSTATNEPIDGSEANAPTWGEALLECRATTNAAMQKVLDYFPGKDSSLREYMYGKVPQKRASSISNALLHYIAEELRSQCASLNLPALPLFSRLTEPAKKPAQGYLNAEFKRRTAKGGCWYKYDDWPEDEKLKYLTALDEYNANRDAARKSERKEGRAAEQRITNFAEKFTSLVS